MKQYFSILIAFAFCLSISAKAGDPTEENKLKVYPNPVERGTVVTIELPAGEYGEVTLALYNTVGRKVYSNKTTSKIIEFKTPSISGIYFLRVFENQKVIAIERIIVRE